MFKETKLNIKNNKLNGKRIIVISDIHYCNEKDIKKLNKVLKVINKYNADYICIPGDIIDKNDMGDKSYIIEWLKRLSSNNIVLLSLGNHDIRTKDEFGKYKEYVDNDFLNEINKIDNLHLLNNNSMSFEDIYFYGYTQSFDYYYKNNYEDKDIMNRELDNYGVCKFLPNKFKVLLMHSPICLTDSNIKDRLNCYDLILCGHMHNGVVPILLDDIFVNNRGIMAPSCKLFPKLARGIVKEKNTLIISSGVTKISRNVRLLRVFNIFFPIGINVIDFNNNEEVSSKYFIR